MVGRDIRDVIMSLWNHHNGYADQSKAMFTAAGRRTGS